MTFKITKYSFPLASTGSATKYPHSGQRISPGLLLPGFPLDFALFVISLTVRSDLWTLGV
jgi:hypothetical protein